MPSRRELLASLGAGGLGALAGCSARRPRTGRWPRAGYDDGNTGDAPDRRGPGGSASVRWTSEFPERGWYGVSSPVLDGRRAYLGYAEPSPTGSGGRVGLRALDLATGEPLGDHTVAAYDGEAPARALHRDSTVYADGSLYLLSWDGLYSLTPDGGVRWRVPTGGVPDVAADWTGHPVVTDGTVFASTAGFAATADDAAEAVLAVDDETGAVRWRYEAPAATRPPAHADGVVYATVLGAGVVALDAATGEVRWERRGPYEGPPTVRGGRVYVAGRPRRGPDTALAALDADTGDQLWEVNPPRLGPWHVAATADAVFHRQRASEVVGRDPATGEVRWRYEGSARVAAGTPAAAGDALYFGVATDRGPGVLALDPERGGELGVTELRGASGSVGGVALSDGLAVLSATSGTVVALEKCPLSLAGRCLY